MTEKVCTHIIFSKKDSPSFKTLKEDIEKGSDDKKYEALRDVITMHINGEPQPKLLVPILNYILPSKNKKLKKLAFYFLELVETKDLNGKLKPEMYLVVNFLRQCLEHPNEYLRGITLRFCCKLKDQEILESIIKPIYNCLEHRHSYVRRNAILAVFSIFEKFPKLLPDAPDDIEKILISNNDASSKRNAFVMLFNCAPQKAIKYVHSIMDKVSEFSDLFQLILLNLLTQMCKQNPKGKSKYLRVIASLLNSKSHSVLYQCSNTLVALSSSSAAIKAAATCYIRLLLNHSDNSVQLIITEKLEDLSKKYPNVMKQVVSDLLRVLSNSSLFVVKKKILGILMQLVNSRNVMNILSTFSKELKKAKPGFDEAGDYDRLLVESFHQCSLKFPEVTNNALVLIDLLGTPSGPQVIKFIRDVFAVNPKLRAQLLSKILSVFDTMTTLKEYNSVLWVLGEYSESESQVKETYEAIKESVVGEDKSQSTKTTEIKDDGSYGKSKEKPAEKQPGLKSILTNGNVYIASVICSTLTKLSSNFSKLKEIDESKKNAFKAEVLILICDVVNIASKNTDTFDIATQERIGLCIKLLADKKNGLDLTEGSKRAFNLLFENKLKREREESEKIEKEKSKSNQVESVLNITQLKGKKYDAFHFDEEDISIAVNSTNKSKDISKLNRVTQLTGFSDPVYAEATITVNEFDILFDVLVVNQTNDTLHNLTLELTTIGDLRLCEKPKNFTLGGFAQQHIKQNIKVSSTETGVIFGSIIYDISGSGNYVNNCVILNNVQVDIMDYIIPSFCDPNTFRSMWFDFEWENKIEVVSKLGLREYLKKVSEVTKMNCLTSDRALEGECQFLSGNLYAKSAFNEHALANVSIEKLDDGSLTGSVRIRSTTQGIAHSLGKKISEFQNIEKSRENKKLADTKKDK